MKTCATCHCDLGRRGRRSPTIKYCGRAACLPWRRIHLLPAAYLAIVRAARSQGRTITSVAEEVIAKGMGRAEGAAA